MPRRAFLRLRRALVPGLVTGLVAGAVVLASCPDEGSGPLAAAGSSTSFVAPSPAASEEVVASRVDPAALARLDGAAAAAGGSISVVVLDAHGETVLASGADEPTYTASLVKLLVVARLMALDESGALALTAEDAGLMEAAITRSDDDAMSALWVEHDGDQLVHDVAADLGLSCTTAPEEAGQWGQAVTTAADVATFLSAVGQVLDADDTATLLGWMRSATGTAADGFDQTFGLLSGIAGDGVAVKQGWMVGAGDRQLHSVGVLADGRVVVLLGEFSGATSWVEAASALDAAAAAVVATT